MTTAPTLTVNAKEARVELARRELARRHLIDFATYMAPWYHPGRHHRLVGEMLELVETFIRTRGATGIGRLMVFMPPRHGKTELVSKMFPAWLLGRQPDKRIILTSYNADLASKNSRAARDYVLDQRYRPVFGDLGSMEQPVEISTDSRSVTAWDLASPHRGGVTAAGVGGGITGTGAHLLIIDDPFKNREEAESPAQRERVEDWYRSSAYTRLEDGGAVVIMHTRWHQDDLAGKRIKAIGQGGDKWVIINLPAIWEEIEIPEEKSFEEYQAEKMQDGVYFEQEDQLERRAGQALWPEKFDEGDLAHIQINIGPYDWSALYQQNPYLRSGNLFRKEWFTIVEAPPKPEMVVMRIRLWDKAGTMTGTGGDYAVGVLMSLTEDELVTVEHVARMQCTPMQREEMILETAKNDLTRKGPRVQILHQQDPGSAGLDSAQATNRMLAKHGFDAKFHTMSGDKEVRAGPWSTACQGGQVRLVRGAWNEAYIEEHLAFPKGAVDDQVDASSDGYSKLMENIDGWTQWARTQLKQMEEANAG